MIITKPKIAVKLFKDKESQFLRQTRKEDRAFKLKNQNRIVCKDIINDSIDFIKYEFRIILSNKKFTDILNLYPYSKVELATTNSFGNSEMEIVSDVICHFFADTRMINYGDTRKDDFSDEFNQMIKELAKEFGYKTV